MQREWTETLRAASAVAKKKTACSRARIQCGVWKRRRFELDREGGLASYLGRNSGRAVGAPKVRAGGIVQLYQIFHLSLPTSPPGPALDA